MEFRRNSPPRQRIPEKFAGSSTRTDEPRANGGKSRRDESARRLSSTISSPRRGRAARGEVSPHVVQSCSVCLGGAQAPCALVSPRFAAICARRVRSGTTTSESLRDSLPRGRIPAKFHLLCYCSLRPQRWKSTVDPMRPMQKRVRARKLT